MLHCDGNTLHGQTLLALPLKYGAVKEMGSSGGPLKRPNFLSWISDVL